MIPKYKLYPNYDLNRYGNTRMAIIGINFDAFDSYAQFPSPLAISGNSQVYVGWDSEYGINPFYPRSLLIENKNSTANAFDATEYLDVIIGAASYRVGVNEWHIFDVTGETEILFSGLSSSLQDNVNCYLSVKARPQVSGRWIQREASHKWETYELMNKNVPTVYTPVYLAQDTNGYFNFVTSTNAVFYTPYFDGSTIYIPTDLTGLFVLDSIERWLVMKCPALATVNNPNIPYIAGGTKEIDLIPGYTEALIKTAFGGYRAQNLSRSYFTFSFPQGCTPASGNPITDFTPGNNATAIAPFTKASRPVSIRLTQNKRVYNG